jgi:PAS domain S-box-containing protein
MTDLVSSWPLGGATVFIVEDEPVVARAVTRALVAIGYRVVGTADDATTALAAIPAAAPDLVVMDIDLRSGLSGVDVAVGLQGVVDVPIVFLTGGTEPDLERLRGLVGVYAYMPKPVNTAAFRATIDLLRMQHAGHTRLRALERRFRTLFDQAAVGVAQVEAGGRLVEVNPTCAQIFGRTVDAMLGTDLVALCAPDQRDALRAGLARLAGGETRALTLELTCSRGDGSAVYVRLDASPLDDAPAPDHVVIVQDVTEQRRAEDALRRHRQLLAESQRIGAVGSFSVDVATGAVTWTEETFHLHGVSPDEFTPSAESILPLVDPADRATVAAAIAEAREPAGQRPPLTYRVVDASGGRRVLHSQSELVRDERGVPVTLLGVVQDVTHRLAAEAAVHASEARYRSIFEHAIGGIVCTTVDGTVVDANPAMIAILGGSCAADLIGTDLRTWFLVPDEARALDLEDRQPGQPLAVTWCRRDGRLASVQIDGLTLGQGRDRRFLGFVRDLTADRARIARESQLVELNEHLELVIAGIGVWDWNPTTGAVHVNAGMLEILGHDQGGAQTTIGAWQGLIHPDDLPAYRRALDAHLAGAGRHFEHVHRIRHRDGRWIHVLDRGRVFERDRDGRPIRFGGTSTDITGEKEAELAAVEASRAKTDFLAAMSHELRTPLNAVLGLSEALLERTFGGLNAAQAASVQTIHDSGQHLLALINDVLDIARVEAGKLPIERERTHLRPLIEESIALVHGQVGAKRQRVLTEVGPALPPALADKRRIKQVLLNLLTNAVKFSPPGATIIARAEARPEQGRVLVSIADTGPGIAAADHARIFEPFVTLDRSLAREHAGAGLGLALVQRIVTLHGGSVRVHSAPGAGATFTIELPIAADGPEASPAARPGAAARRVRAGAPTLLLAEDNEASIVTFQGYLENAGYALRVVRDGRAAVAAAALPDVAVVLMDVQLPELDGLEAIRRIRATREGAGLAIIALTAYAMPGDEERCLAAGASAYLAKPVRLRQLADTIERLLDQRELQR